MTIKNIATGNLLILLGKACLFAILSYQQPSWGMDSSKMKFKEPKPQIHQNKGSSLFVVQSPNKQLANLFKVYIQNYPHSQNKGIATKQFDNTIRELFSSLHIDQWESFISTLKILYNDNKVHIDNSDQQILDFLIESLDQQVKNTNSHGLVPYHQEHQIVQHEQGAHIPKLQIPQKSSNDEPIALTENEIKAGGNTTPVQLIQKTMTSKESKEKPCYQFETMNHTILIYNNNPSPCYDHSTLQNHLNLTEKVYNNAIEQIQQKAYRALKTTLDAKHIDESVIKTLLSNYLDSTNHDKVIDVTGSSLKPQEIQDFNYYMKLCNAVYTDFYTREFLHMQDLPSVKKKWNKIIQQYNEITKLRDTVVKIREKYEELVNQKTVYEEKSKKNEMSKQTLGLDRKPQVELIEKDYMDQIKLINSFLKTINRPLITDEKLENIATLVKTLNEIKQEIDSEYSWYFETTTKLPKAWAIELGAIMNYMGEKFLGGEQAAQIPEFTDVESHKHQLTAKAVVESSFLNKAKLSNNDNITVLDIGFRNEEKFGSAWNDFVTTIMKIKANKKAWFENWGEVDYIAYIEKDHTPNKKDKLVLVYAGSNSQMDWGIDFTIGNSAFLGLSVHEGIGWLFQTTTNTYHNVLMERIRNYYKENDKPHALEIVTTGHSLGAGLAELAAYYYKTKQLKEFSDIVNPSQITVKTYTYAAPAIVDESSKETIENALGKDNIYRIWVTNDPVAVLSETFKVQGGKHIGKSYPLYNIQNLAFNYFDWWGPHGAERYISYLHQLEQSDYTTQYKNLVGILNNYITTSDLYVYKMNRWALLQIIDNFKQTNPHLPISLHQGLAEHIIKYSPSSVNLKPYATVGEILSHSPRYAAALSPRFEVEIGEPVLETGNYLKDRFKIDAIFKITVDNHQKIIDFPIVASTDCSMFAVQNFLKSESHITLDEKSVEPFSCGVCLAKRVFVSQYPENIVSAYHGTALTGKKYETLQTPHQDTLTKMFAKCVEEKACTPEYLKQTSQGKNMLDQAYEMLDKIGLGEAFKNKKVHFSRFESQDKLANETRPGIDITLGHKEKSNDMLDEGMIKLLLENTNQYKASINFSPEELSNVNHICQKLINATNSVNHWNTFSSLINEKELTNLILHNSVNHDNSEAIVESMLNNFIQNLTEMLTTYYAKQYESSSLISRPYTINKSILEKDLQRLKANVQHNTSWAIKEHKHPQQQHLAIEGPHSLLPGPEVEQKKHNQEQG